MPSSSHIYASLIWDINGFLSRDWRVELHHTLTEENTCADFLAKFGAQQDNTIVALDYPLEGMSLLLLVDAMEYGCLPCETLIFFSCTIALYQKESKFKIY